ncbi:TITAN-like protein isoform X2 [Macadamia integrifolia]|uniref:TITAN-like protein isoform X2 n=1 Tax=Macadamia integrifolia TaxID=60698 RepID=UPI001C501B1D|nr:TITAN-like protein isoform X2 [Macadamia integrifolia]
MEERQLNDKPNPNPKNYYNNNDEEEKKKRKQKQEFEFCKVCNLNHDKGRRHNYFPNHIKALSSFLSRFLKKMSDVRFFLKNPLLLRTEHAGRNRLWCVFCDCDVQELGSSFACSNAIIHLASSEHLKNLKHFLWKYGGEMDRVDAFRISEADLLKWEKRCESLKSLAASPNEGFYELSNDIQNKLCSENMHNFEKNSVVSFKSSFSNSVLPLQCSTDERCHIFHPEITKVAHTLQHDCTSLPVDMQGRMHSQGMHVTKSMTMDLKVISSCTHDLANGDSQHSLVHNSRGSSVGWSSSNGGVYQFEIVDNGGSSNQVVQSLTPVSQLLAEETKGNVHSGAPPPWFEDKYEDNQLNVEVNAGLCTSSFASPLEKIGKTQKLNPKRVGAAWAEKRKIELEKEKRGEIVSGNCDTDWLPNFGRVWQSGSRKESRKEFEKEKQKFLKADSLTETTTKIQPYISKRLRKDAGESNFPTDKSS